jgi:hypothetical protein
MKTENARIVVEVRRIIDVLPEKDENENMISEGGQIIHNLSRYVMPLSNALDKSDDGEYVLARANHALKCVMRGIVHKWKDLAHAKRYNTVIEVSTEDEDGNERIELRPLFRTIPEDIPIR